MKKVLLVLMGIMLVLSFSLVSCKEKAEESSVEKAAESSVEKAKESGEEKAEESGEK